MNYDPSIQALLLQIEDDWGDDPIKNRDKLVPYGIRLLDETLWGINVIDGELIVIQGEQKNRKTTLLVNILINMFLHSKIQPVVNVDTLESGMPPQRYRDTMVANLATRYLYEQGHNLVNVPDYSGATEFGVCEICSGYQGSKTHCLQTVLSPEFLRFSPRTKDQLNAINKAIDTMMGWNLFIHGASLSMGNTRNLADALVVQGNRWHKLHEEKGVNIYVSDHVQQYAWADSPSDYEKQLRSIGALGDFVSQHNVVCFLLSQVSLWSAQQSKTNSGKMVASGGNKASSEANVVLSARYNDNSSMMGIEITDSRKSGGLTIYQPLDDSSGSFYGQASRHIRQDKPEKVKADNNGQIHF